MYAFKFRHGGTRITKSECGTSTKMNSHIHSATPTCTRLESERCDRVASQKSHYTPTHTRCMGHSLWSWMSVCVCLWLLHVPATIRPLYMPWIGSSLAPPSAVDRKCFCTVFIWRKKEFIFAYLHACILFGCGYKHNLFLCKMQFQVWSEARWSGHLLSRIPATSNRAILQVGQLLLLRLLLLQLVFVVVIVVVVLVSDWHR